MKLLNKITLWLIKGQIKKQIERWKKMAMEEQKPWYLSTGVIGGLVVFAISIAGVFGVVGLEAEKGQITELVLQCVTAVAGLVAVYGRMTATKKIKK